MNYHLISDSHFNHTKLEEWGGRSGNWQEQILEGIKKIPAGDVLIHMGDICIGDDEAINFKINQMADAQGFKTILVRGNHDNKSVAWYYAHGWDFVCDSFHLIFEGHYLYFSHRPSRQMDAFTHNIHGHTHGNLHRSEEYMTFYQPYYHIDISPELVGYAPLRLDTLMGKVKKKQLTFPSSNE